MDEHKRAKMTGAKITPMVTALSLFIAAASLGILIAQELRVRRNRPNARLDSKVVGSFSVNGAERWDLIELTNIGTGTLTQITSMWVGVEVFSSGTGTEQVEYKVPPVMGPGATIRLGVRGDTSAAWLFYSGAVHGVSGMWAAWSPLDTTGPAPAAWLELAGREADRREHLKRPWRWRRSNPPRFRPNLSGVGPFEGGTVKVALHKMKEDSVQEFITARNAVELPGIAKRVWAAKPDQDPQGDARVVA